MAKEVTKEAPQEQGKLVPMPPVGWLVQICEKGNPKNVFPGVVSGHNADPGQCRIIYHVGTIHRVSENATYAPLVNPATAGNNATVKAFGTWNYLPGQAIPKEHYDFHMKRIDELERQAEIRRANDASVAASYQESLKTAGSPEALGVAVQRAQAVMAAAGQNA
jgi:hypothetical protein